MELDKSQTLTTLAHILYNNKQKTYAGQNQEMHKKIKNTRIHYR